MKSIPDLLAAYTAAADSIRKAIAGLSREDMLARPIAGKWSSHEVVIHLRDADESFAHRMKRIVAEDEPAYAAWSENRFIERLRYHEQSAEEAIKTIELLHNQLLVIFRPLPPEAFDRVGLHAERGRQTLTEVLTYATWHVEHHLSFVAEKRAAMGQ